MSTFMHTFVVIMLIILGLLLPATILYAVLGKRFTDKIVATNAIGSLGVNLIVVLAILLGADYILDVSLVYAMLSFLAVVVLCRFCMHRILGKMARNSSGKNTEKAGEDQL